MLCKKYIYSEMSNKYKLKNTTFLQRNELI